jgi:hypothetical protein
VPPALVVTDEIVVVVDSFIESEFAVTVNVVADGLSEVPVYAPA